MMSKLRAVVVGAGWAGELHTQALQYAGVKVVALCGREPQAVQKAALHLGVAVASTDSRDSLLNLKPDIVTIATPASLRRDTTIDTAGKFCGHKHHGHRRDASAIQCSAFFALPWCRVFPLVNDPAGAW